MTHNDINGSKTLCNAIFGARISFGNQHDSAENVKPAVLVAMRLLSKRLPSWQAEFASKSAVLDVFQKTLLASGKFVVCQCSFSSYEDTNSTIVGELRSQVQNIVANVVGKDLLRRQQRW